MPKGSTKRLSSTWEFDEDDDDDGFRGDSRDGRIRRPSSYRKFPEQPLRTKISKVLGSMPFRILVAVVVTINMIVLTIDTDARVAGEGAERFYIVNLAFLAFYIFDMGLQVFVDRKNFLRHPMNVLDTISVISGLADVVLSEYDLPNLQMLRIARSLRLLRIFKLTEIFPSLYAMVHGIWSTIVAMSWGVLLLLLISFVVSIVAVESVSSYGDAVFDDSYCDTAFSSVYGGVIFFFGTVVLGDNWGNCIMPLIMRDWAWAVFFIGVSVLIQVGVLNLILAVIVDEANSAREADQERMAREMIQKKKGAARQLEDMFIRFDTNGDGKVRLDEFISAAKSDPQARNIMHMLDVNVSTLKELFRAMDENGDNDVSASEFCSFLWKILFTDVKTQMMATRINLDRVTEDQKHIIEHLEAQKCSTEPHTQSFCLEEPESVAERLRALEALAEGHQQLLAAVDRRLAQVLEERVPVRDAAGAADAARPSPLSSAGAPGADEERPRRGTGDGTARAAPLTMEGASGISPRPSPRRAGFRADLAEPASTAAAAVDADAGALAEGEANAQQLQALAPRESDASLRDGRDGGAGSHWAGQTRQQIFHVDPDASGSLRGSDLACSHGGRQQGPWSDDPPAPFVPLGAAASAPRAPQLPLRVRSAGFAPSGRRAPSRASAAAWAGVYPVARETVSQPHPFSGGLAWGGQPASVLGFSAWDAPLNVSSPSDCERMHAVHSFILNAGMSTVPFDKLVLYLDSLGIELSIHEQDTLKSILQLRRSF